MANILICDDEFDIVNALEIYLLKSRFDVFKAYNGLDAIKSVKENDIDLVLLDCMMPKMDGITALEEIRKTSNIPVIMLTAKDQYDDKIIGLGSGADDYITKPFNPRELIARVKAQLRRYTYLGSNVKVETLKSGGILLDNNLKIVTVDGDRVKLTPTEFEILKLLMQNIGQVFSSDEIYTSIWSDYSYGVQNTIAVHIRHLREKIEINPRNPRYVKVVWGRGYKFDGSLER